MARILGTKEFWGLPLKFSAATLVPRPDTETVVEAVLEILRAEGRPRTPLRIADLGTGTGAILLALLTELPDALGVGTDISVAALRYCARQCPRPWPGVARRLRRCDYASACRNRSTSSSRTRPISARTNRGVGAEVRDHDPHLALDGGHDGLEAYRRIARKREAAAPRGVLVWRSGRTRAATSQVDDRRRVNGRGAPQNRPGGHPPRRHGPKMPRKAP